jgi:P-type Mg2+ transporter
MLQNNVDSFYRNDSNAVLTELGSSISGLSSEEAKKRLDRYGPNALAEKKEINIFLDFFSHFLNPLILILCIAAIMSVFMGEESDAVIIGFIILFGVLLDFVQEYNADKALKKLVDSVKTTSTVIRGGNKSEINVSDLVPGDVIFLSSGDMVPADARVIEAKYFFVNQSSITGESYPSEKTSEKIVRQNVSLSDLSNIVFRGTNVVSGSATAVILKTGKDTEFGKIASKLSEKPVRSDFEKSINDFGFFLMKIILILVVFIFFANSFLKHDYFQSFMFAIAIAVGVTPELLPMIMSVTMTIGSKKMLKKGVIVKKLSSIPNFGSMNILCTDKTGTLTENSISLVKYNDIMGNASEEVLTLTYFNSFFQTGIKNTLDEAVLGYKKIEISTVKKIDEIPYDFVRKKMSVVVSIKGKRLLITKGAPEEIFKSCSYCIINGKKKVMGEQLKKKATGLYHNLSEEGFRVLSIAVKELKDTRKAYSKDDENGMCLKGFVSFLDPPKKDVKETIKCLKELGVEVKIITGDNELVTKKICSEVGLEIKGILFGQDLSSFTDDALRVKAQNTTIFVRCSPDEKDRIITVLRANNNVVGYLGDGINDAPSLRTADVGISVDSAVDVAKESADIVLTKKSLTDLKEGIIEGRKTFGNTIKYIMMALSSNFGNMFSAAGAILFLPFLPMLPIQILLNNLIYDFSQVTIPSDNVDDDWVKSPRKWNLSFLKKFMYVFGPISSLFDYITFFVLFFVIKASAPVFQTGWFMESLATQTLVIHVIRTKRTPILKSRSSKLLVLSSILCLATGWLLPYTPIGKFFKFEPLPWNVCLILAGIVIVYLFVVEFAKRMFYRKVNF